MSIINIDYMSPMTNYTFSKLDKYYLVISFMDSNNSITIYKHELTLNNINNTVRAYHISQSINVNFPEIPIKYTIQIFKHDKSNIITLLFTNLIDFSVFEYNNIQAITLYAPDSVITKKNTTYVGLKSFLSEQFFNYETLAPTNQCLLFLTLKTHTRFPTLEPAKLNINNLGVLSYNKYHGTFMIPIKQKQTNNYIDFLRYYQTDIQKFVPKMETNFRDMLLRKMDMSKRPITYDGLLNNVVVCPSDCRMKKISDNSFSFFMRPNDYPRFHMPYQGWLVGMKSKKINDNECLILNFTNDYYMPHSVGEREYISVLFGHNIAMSRGYPELVDVQPDTTLNFDLIFVGSNDKESIILTNEKLINYKGKVWVGQKDELLMFNNCMGQCIMSFNRKIEYNLGIKNNVENYIKLNDEIAYIQ